MEKVYVDENTCIRCGMCVGMAPEKFQFGEDGAAEAIDETVTEKAIEVSEACPVSAIKIVKEETPEVIQNNLEQNISDDKINTDTTLTEEEITEENQDTLRQSIIPDKVNTDTALTEDQAKEENN